MPQLCWCCSTALWYLLTVATTLRRRYVSAHQNVVEQNLSRHSSYLVDESYRAVHVNYPYLFALQRWMGPDSQTCRISGNKFSEFARLINRFFRRDLTGRRHSLRRFLHFDFVRFLHIISVDVNSYRVISDGCGCPGGTVSAVAVVPHQHGLTCSPGRRARISQFLKRVVLVRLKQICTC
jgi:hypothetical protein